MRLGEIICVKLSFSKYQHHCALDCSWAISTKARVYEFTFYWTAIKFADAEMYYVDGNSGVRHQIPLKMLTLIELLLSALFTITQVCIIKWYVYRIKNIRSIQSHLYSWIDFESTMNEKVSSTWRNNLNLRANRRWITIIKYPRPSETKWHPLVTFESPRWNTSMPALDSPGVETRRFCSVIVASLSWYKETMPTREEGERVGGETTTRKSGYAK